MIPCLKCSAFCNGIYLYYSRKHFICQGDCGGGSVSISKPRRCVCADEAASVQPCWNRASKTPPDLAGKLKGKNSMVGQKADASYGSRGVDRKTRPIGLKLDCLNRAPHHQESDPPRRGERYGRKTSGSSNSPDGESLKGQEPVGNTRSAPKTLRAWTCKTRMSR